MNEKKKKYQVNLPKTDFPMKASLATREPERLNLWKNEELGQRVLTMTARAKESFVLHDGPPYANGQIHIGHALNKTLKDIVVKYRTAQGYRTTYVPGWDCHGLPIEQALLKEQGKRKDQVDQTAFRKEARAYAEKYINIQREDFKRLGIFGAWDDPYLTMNFGYQATIARSFYELYNKGFVYRGEKPVYWSIGAETALAEAELEYQDKESEAIYVSFPIPADDVSDVAREALSLPGRAAGVSGGAGQDGASVSFVIWTTTPWTLPANVGVAVHPDLEYGAYRVGDDVYVFAVALAERLSQKLQLGSVQLLGTVRGAELVELLPTYRHPFIDRTGRAILADYVSGTDGTGIVHIAPGHGEEDYVHGHVRNGLPIVSPVDHAGRFTEDFGDVQIKGVNVFEANAAIIAHLQQQGRLKGREKHQHSYPFCWRTKTPVIVRSTPQWFLKIDHERLRERVMDVIEDLDKTRWFPEWGKNRILGMMESRPDWCLSRQRLWGVPVPVARHTQTGEVYCPPEFQARVLEIFEREGADAWFARPKKDFFPDGADADRYALETDILDVWFDSGVSHQAVLERGHKLGFPCGLYLEGSDQHRGWFQTSLITAVALRNVAPFQHVLTHGFVMDGEGKKMSKSLGNVVSPQDVMKQYGADILRLWVSSCDINHDVRLSPEILERMAEAYRKIRNTFRYLLGNLADFDPSSGVAFGDMESIDKWALSRLHDVAVEVEECYESYRFHRIYQLIYEFCVTDLSSFYLDVLKDRMYCSHPQDALRRSAQSAMFAICKTLCQLTSPILVFTADEVWRSARFGVEASVHESLWDETLWGEYDEAALRTWSAVREARRVADLAVEQLRARGDIGTALDCEVTVWSGQGELMEWLQALKPELELGLIVSGVTFGADGSGAGDARAVETVTWTDDSGAARTGELAIGARKAGGRKCGRCWKYYDEVGTLDDPELCGRCFDAEKRLAAV